MSNTLLKWFTDNLLNANLEKSCRMVITNSKCEKLQGIHIDNKLTFEPHVRCLCKKASQKLNAFARIAYSVRFE